MRNHARSLADDFLISYLETAWWYIGSSTKIALGATSFSLLKNPGQSEAVIQIGKNGDEESFFNL
jgi:hypothetical protein